MGLSVAEVRDWNKRQQHFQISFKKDGVLDSRTVYAESLTQARAKIKKFFPGSKIKFTK